MFCFPFRDLVAIIAVLEHNQWFNKLSTKDYKLVMLIQQKTAVDLVVWCLSKINDLNVTVETFVMGRQDEK